jgi:hypothetical protein
VHVENEKQLLLQEQHGKTAEPAAADRTQSDDGAVDAPPLANHASLHPAAPAAASLQGESSRAEEFPTDTGRQTAENTESSSLSKAISGW